ncbi:glycosyltransferase [Streptomyces sanglieri]
MAEPKSIGIYLTSMTIGGAERVALDLSSGLSSRGYDVDLVLVDASGDLLDEVPDDVSIVDLEARRVATSLLPLRQYLTSREPDVLYSMMTEPNLIAITAHQLASTDTRLVISEHNMLSHSIDSLKDRLVTLGAWAGYPIADHAVAVSKGVRRDLLDRTRLEDDSISMIYNPVRVETIREKASESVDHEWLADESIKVVLSGGRHEPQKGFDTLLEAFAHLERENVRLILFGKGPETEVLQRQAIELGISDRVSFPGFVDNPYSYMSAADVFVLSSVHEGFGLVLIEAMACGCPVVSTDCESGPDEILEGEKYGQLVPVGNEDALAKAIIQTLDAPPNANTLKNRADDFGIDAIIPEYKTVLSYNE